MPTASPKTHSDVKFDVPPSDVPTIEKIIELAGNYDMPPEQKKARLAELDPDGTMTTRTFAHLETRMVEMNATREKMQLLSNSWSKYRHWEETETCQFILQLNDCSRIHKVREAADAGLFYDGDDRRFASPGEITDQIERAKVFVVRHDWAAAFGDALDNDNPFKLPAEICAFEFRVTGHSIIMFAQEAENRYGVDTLILFEGEGGLWFTMPTDSLDDIAAFLTRQMKAICVALEAQVAEHSVTRAPFKLNAKRARDGKPPLRDFHIVDLSKRSRAAARADTSNPSGRRVRLHFRRGHWRHYEDHKTWIEWMLVGNPNLGFIDKQYRI